MTGAFLLGMGVLLIFGSPLAVAPFDTLCFVLGGLTGMVGGLIELGKTRTDL